MVVSALMMPPADQPKPWAAPDPRPTCVESERFVIRAYEHDDADQLYEAINTDRDSYKPWLPWVDTDNTSVAQCHYSIELFKRAWAKADNLAMGFVMGVFEKDSGRLVAGTGIHRLRTAGHEGEIGYWTRASDRGRGVATEASARLISWCFTPPKDGGWGLRRITVFCAAPNTASARVPTKLRLPPESHARKETWVEGLGWTDHLGWAVLEEDWDRENHAMKPA